MKNKTELILVSFLGLFLELSLIRWLPAHIFSIAFFSNTVLIASFLGLGLGLLFSHNKRDFFDFFIYILAGAVCLVLLFRNANVKLPPAAQTWIWSYYEGNRLDNFSFLKISITQLVSLVYVVTVAVFVPVGQKIGKCMLKFPPLFAYTLNIIGSLLGVFAFGILTLSYAPAYIWFLAAGIIIVFTAYKKKRFFINLLIMVSAVITIAAIEKSIIWSPYYAINFKIGDDRSVAVYVNQLFHQKAVNFEKEPDLYNKYIFPYELFRPRRVLIVGAGTGNDVWVALKSGAERIDAVEIDPSILALGRRGHPQFPYRSDKVHVFIEDARSFLHRAPRAYDMVVYGTLDSHASLSVASSIRLDNYMYTQEALREARRLLAADGVIVLLFSVPTDWIAMKLIETSRAVFGEENTRYSITENYLFNLMIVAGPGVKNALSANPGLARILLPLPAKSNIALPTDDWPYLYLKERSIPRLYLTALAALVCISLALIFIFSPLRGRKIELSFFLLGCGFLLLETKSVTTFALLFGSTWLVNAVVFASILTIGLLANWVVMRKQPRHPPWLFGGLILSLLFLYFFPLRNLLNFNFFSKIFLAGMLLALPVLFSSLIFALLFKRTKDAGVALGSNLLGAVLGGFMEYLSMIYGLNVLYLIALGCYCAAALWFMRVEGAGAG